MSRLLAIVLMFTFPCGTIAADRWVQMRFDNDETTYVDTTTVSRSGNLVKAWTMRDLHVPIIADGLTIYSSKSYKQYRCHERTSSLLQYIEYSGKMGSGEVLTNLNKDAENWRPIVPDSVGETVFNNICKTYGARK